MNKFWAFDEKLDIQNRKMYPGDKPLEELVVEPQEKVIILISGYLYKIRYNNFSLISDSQFVIQNAIRLLRCLLELCIKKNLAFNVELIHRLCKQIENRMLIQ